METDESGETKQTRFFFFLLLLFLFVLFERAISSLEKKKVSTAQRGFPPPVYLASGYRLSRYRIKE